ncbi:MAG: hypothetical protein R3A47_02465 [Polyangiales bacterium]
MKDGFATADYFPHQRIGAHVGMTVRIKRLDISVAYTHYFLKDVNNSLADALNADGTAKVPQTVTDINGVALNTGTPQSAGRFSGKLDIASLALNYHFR